MNKKQTFIEITPRDIYNLVKENTAYTLNNGKKIDKINGSIRTHRLWLKALTTGLSVLAGALGSAFLFIIARLPK